MEGSARSALASLDFHRQSPDVPLDIYSLAKRLALGKYVANKRRIYLDLRYWIFCRDAFLGKPSKEIHRLIWDRLRVLATSGNILCPVCDPVFCETLKMRKSSRAAIAKVIDALARGVAIQPLIPRTSIELSHFVWTELLGNTTISPLTRQVWLPLGYIFGECIPTDTAFGTDDELAMQKSMFDTFETVAMSDLVESFDDDDPHADLDDSVFQEGQTIRAALHRHEFSTFQEAYGHEIDGTLDVISDSVLAFAEELFEQNKTIDLGAKTAKTPQESAKTLNALLRSGFKKSRITTQFPHPHICAGIHAAIRHKRQRYHRGDRWDHLHASAALPYCDAFFTEKSLAHLLTKKPLEYDKKYNCTVLFDEQDVLAYLEAIPADSTPLSMRAGSTEQPAKHS